MQIFLYKGEQQLVRIPFKGRTTLNNLDAAREAGTRRGNKLVLMVGDWQDLGGSLTDDTESTSVSLQPLALIHHVPERAWAADWLVDIVTLDSNEPRFQHQLNSGER